MSDATRNAKAVSVRARLLNLARDQGRSFDLLVQRYAIERLLYRLARSPHADSFVLKGAMVFLSWGIDLRRPTRDLDLMGLGSPDTDRLGNIIAEVASIAVEQDGLEFILSGIIAERIREEAIYSGVRVTTPVTLGSMKINLQIDIGLGDSLVPAPEWTSFPTLLGGSPPFLRTYSPYLVVAEKYETMVKLGEANSRMKDFYDVWLIKQSFAIDRAILSNSVAQTFARRGTVIPMSRPIALSEAFYGRQTKQQQWKAFASKSKRNDQAPSLQKVCDAIWSLVGQRGSGQTSR